MKGENCMRVFAEMASIASSHLLGASAEGRISNEQLAEQMAEIALHDPELAEHYARMAAAQPALRTQRGRDDSALLTEWRGSGLIGLIRESKRCGCGETSSTTKAAPW
jgi:hypothetical protein